MDIFAGIAGILVAGGTLVLAFATWRLARQTERMADETAHMARETERMAIATERSLDLQTEATEITRTKRAEERRAEVVFIRRGHHAKAVDVRNIGRGIARDVRFYRRWNQTTAIMNTLEHAPLTPGGEVRLILNIESKLSDDEAETTREWNAAYRITWNDDAGGGDSGWVEEQ